MLLMERILVGGNQCVLERTHPVILTLLEVAANSGQTIGTFADLESDTNYITHGATRRLGQAMRLGA